MGRWRPKSHLLQGIVVAAALSSTAIVSAKAHAQAAMQAQTELTATTLHKRGQYEEAIARGRADATLEGLVAAAKSALFLAAYQETDKEQARALLAEAIADAQRALKIQPNHIDATLQLAIGEGYTARIKMSPKRAKKAREKAEWLVENAPGNAYALGLLGGWHGEAIAAFGKLIADVTVGADVTAFERFFDEALANAPNNPLVTAYYVRLLLDINDDGMREKAAALLTDIDRAETANAFESYMKDRALALKAALEAGDKKALKRLIKQQRPFRGQK